MKTVLIYVLSAEMHPYPELRDVAMRTWDSKTLEGTETLYYTADKSAMGGTGQVVRVPIDDGLYQMGRKDLWAYEWALNNRTWDYMARVNSSCYVRKQQVLDVCQGLPEKKVFRGVGAPGENNGPRYLWGGAQYIISRDVVQSIVYHKDKWNHAKMEDVAMSGVVRKLGIPFDEKGDAASVNKRGQHGWTCYRYVDGGMGNFEFETFAEMKEKIGACPFVRVKQDGDRGKDIWIMEKMHEVGI